MVTARCSAVTLMVMFFWGCLALFLHQSRCLAVSGMRYLKSLGIGIRSLGLAVIKWVLSVNPYLSNTLAPKYDNIYG